MSTFSSTPVAVAYALFVLMGVVALLNVSGVVTEAFVQRRILPVLAAALLLLGLWEYRLRREGGGDHHG